MHELAVSCSPAGFYPTRTPGSWRPVFPTAALAEFAVGTQWRQLDAGSGRWCASSGRAICRGRLPDGAWNWSSALDPDDAARLPRLALLAPLRRGRARSRAVRIVWHDSPDRALAQQGLALAEQRPLWRLERLRPGDEPGRRRAGAGPRDRAPTAPLSATRCPIRWCRSPPSKAAQRSIDLATEHGPLTMTVLNGVVRTVADRAPRQPDPTRGRLRRRCRQWRSHWPENCALRCRAPAWPPRRWRIAIRHRRCAAAGRRAELPSRLSVADAFAHVAGSPARRDPVFRAGRRGGRRRAGAGAPDACRGPPAAVGDQGVPTAPCDALRWTPPTRA